MIRKSKPAPRRWAITRTTPARRALLALATAALCGVPSVGWAQGTAGARNSIQRPPAARPSGGMDLGSPATNDYPKISFDTLANYEFAGLFPDKGRARGPQPFLRFDSTLLVDLSESLSIDGLLQYKARQPRPADDPDGSLFINQGASRKTGAKMKEFYVRYGTWRAGKLVPDFGRAYNIVPGPYSADFVEEADEGYEPADMLALEKLWVLSNEREGWQQITISLLMADRTPLSHSWPYDEGPLRYKDGGVGNTRWPENVMVTYDVLNIPIAPGVQANFQASAIRWGKSYRAQRGEIWTTLGGDVVVPLRNSVADTLDLRYSRLHFYVEAARRENFNGFIGRARNYVTVSGEYLQGRWVADLTTTQRWTTDRVEPTRTDRLYTATLGYNVDAQTLFSFSGARENVGDRAGVYAGLRLTRTFTACSRCQLRGRAY